MEYQGFRIVTTRLPDGSLLQSVTVFVEEANICQERVSFMHNGRTTDAATVNRLIA